MKELLERHKARLTPDEDRRIWQGLTDARRPRPLWRRWKISVPALAAAAAAAFAVAILNQSTLMSPRTQAIEDHMAATPTTDSMTEDTRGREIVSQSLKSPDPARTPGIGTAQDVPGESDGSETPAVEESQTQRVIQSLGKDDNAPAGPRPVPEAETPVAADRSAGTTQLKGSVIQDEGRFRTEAEPNQFRPDASRSLAAKPVASPSEPMTLVDRDESKEKRQAEDFVRRIPVPEPIAVGGDRPVNGKVIDAMFFEHYGVNPFVDPEEDRFATFAMDVDHASYTLARSYLRRGVLPPKEAIRVEEFVNAFDHRYAAPSDQFTASRDLSEHGTFAIHLDSAPSPFGEGLVLMRVGLKGMEIHERNRKPARLTFVIDVSGSMARENRLGLVKESLYLLLDRMNGEDEVALVVYGSNARTVLPPTSLLHRRSIERAIASLQPEGATNAEAGLALGYSIAERNYRPDCINRVILCSDGVANVGQTGAEDILDEIHRRAGEGIYLTATGFGMGNYNDVLMEKLADRGEGNYYYIDSVDEARDVFLENLMGTLQVIARQAKIQVEFDPETVRRYRLLGYENRDVADRDFRNDRIDAGEVGAGHEVTALFELKLNRRPGDVVGIARIRYEDPESGRVTEEKRELRTRDLVTRLERSKPSLRLDAAVAEFAEILRHSYWARDGRLDRTLDVARDAARELGPSEEITEFLSLVETAARIWTPDNPTRPDDIRPAWEPEDDR